MSPSPGTMASVIVRPGEWRRAWSQTRRLAMICGFRWLPARAWQSSPGTSTSPPGQPRRRRCSPRRPGCSRSPPLETCGHGICWLSWSRNGRGLRQPRKSLDLVVGEAVRPPRLDLHGYGEVPLVRVGEVGKDFLLQVGQRRGSTSADRRGTHRRTGASPWVSRSRYATPYGDSAVLGHDKLGQEGVQ